MRRVVRICLSDDSYGEHWHQDLSLGRVQESWEDESVLLGKTISLSAGFHDTRSEVDPIKPCFDQRPFTVRISSLEITLAMKEGAFMLIIHLAAREQIDDLAHLASEDLAEKHLRENLVVVAQNSTASRCRLLSSGQTQTLNEIEAGFEPPWPRPFRRSLRRGIPL